MQKKFFGIIWFLVFSWSSVAIAGETADTKQFQQKVLTAVNGRYVFGQISNFRRDQYLLDTQTGRLWVMVEDKDNNSKLQPVPIVQLCGDEAYIPDPQHEVDEHRKLVRKKTTEEIKKLLEEDKAKKK